MLLGSQSRPSLFARFTASLAIVLVLALTVLSASPELHERLHGHQAPASAAHHDPSQAGGARANDGDEGCIVTLFAQGIVLALALLALALMGRVVRVAATAGLDRVIPEAPRYLHLPTQAPPLA